MFEDHVDDARGGRLRLAVEGDGPGVVLLHGGGVVSADYARLSSALSRRCTVYRYDRRGRPGGPPIGSGHTVGDDVADLERVLVHTGASRVFAHSGGAFVALQAGLRLPLSRLAVYDPGVSIGGTVPSDWFPAFTTAVARGDRVRAMVLAGLGAQGGESAAGRLPSWLQSMIVQLFLATSIGRRMGDLLPSMVTEVGAIIAGDAPAQAYSGVNAESLLTYGTRSAGYFRTNCDSLAAAMPRARSVAIPGAGHNAANVARPAFVQPFADFLSA